ncbi:MAG: IPT/TIG domain-containing protein [Acidobacteriota bacterium]
MTAPLRIDAIIPDRGPIAGGTEVRLIGAGFTSAVVRLDDVVVAPIGHSDGELRLRMPAHDNGFAVITIQSTSGTAYAEYLYVPPRLRDLPAGYITTVAGIGAFSRDYGPAVRATVDPAGLALDPRGYLYLAEPNNDRVSRVRADGTFERLTARHRGPLAPGAPTGDGGPSVHAPVMFPLSIAVDPGGNVLIPDQNGRVRRIDAGTGIITTIAGDGRREYRGDGGPAAQASFGWLTHIAADAQDVFVIDFAAGRVRRINLATGTIVTAAGTGVPGYSGDGGPATLAQFDVGDADSGFLALDRSGHLYLADTENYRIRRIDRQSGVITTFYTLPRQPALDYVGRVRSLAFDRAGNLYYGGSSRIVKVSPSGVYLDSWGSGTPTLPVEGGSARAEGLGLVTGLAVADDGTIYYTDGAVSRVRRIDVRTGRLYTVAGIGPSTIGDEGQVFEDVPAYAVAMRPLDIAVAGDGALLIGDAFGRIRRLDRDGVVTTIAGTGSFVGQPLPAPARLASIGAFGIEANPDGTVDMVNWSHIERLGIDGIVRTVAGRNAVCAYTGDGGPATEATFCQAWDAVRDRHGHLYVADTNNNRIRRVDAATGRVSTVVGNGGPVNGWERYGNGQSCGDGGPAVDACINTPKGVAVDEAGSLYLSEQPAIRRVAPDGRITTLRAVANTTKLVYHRGYLYAGVIAGLFRLDAAGNQTWIVGEGGSVGQAGFGGDGGPAALARVHLSAQAAGIAIDAEDNLYFVDAGRVRAVRLGAR